MLATIFVRIIYIVFIVGFLLVITDEGLRIYRGWMNKDGTEVDGYGLYEREIISKRLSETMPDVFKHRTPGWEPLHFYQYEFPCNWRKNIKQNDWINERERKLKAKMYATQDSPKLFTEEELPLVRYECVPMKMFYRTGMGWGLF